MWLPSRTHMLLARKTFPAPDAWRKRLRVAADERTNHAAVGRTDLVSLAVEFGVGHWHAGRREPADDRDLAADVWPGGAKADKRCSVKKRICHGGTGDGGRPVGSLPPLYFTAK